MKAEREIARNEWLLGSTILCESCGCLWLVPAAKQGESYQCRQCGGEVNAVATKKKSDPPKSQTIDSRKRPNY